MNSFNSTQNQVLYNTESPEGGAGQVNGVQEANQKNLAEQGLESRNISEVRAVDTESDKTFDLAGFDTLIEQAAAKGEVYNASPFETDPETGLSLQGKQIEDLKDQLEGLENDQAIISSIAGEIAATRNQERDVLNTKLEQYKSIREGLNTKIQAAINKSTQPNRTIEDFISGSVDLQAKVAGLDEAIKGGKEALDDFDAETTAQVEQAIQDKKTELQQQLAEAQTGYTESGAEFNDKKVLLELGLQDQLTDPNQLFSTQNIDQIFETYGLKDGLHKLEDIKKASYQAREQAARNQIQGEIFSTANWYNNNPELAAALSEDMQPKLEALQESNPDSKIFSQALSLEGSSRLDYLTDSGDSQLQELAFWFNAEASIDQVLADNPQFAKYLDKETNTRYEQQKAQKTEFSQRKDSELNQSINNRIATQLENSKNTRIQELQKELSLLKFDENGLDYNAQDRAILSERERLSPVEIKQFQTDLQQALESGQIKFEQGQFSGLENIIENQQVVNQQLEALFNQIKPVLEAAGYALQSLESLSSTATNIEQDQEKAKNKPFGLGKKQAQALSKLLEEVDKTISKYNQLQADKQKNTEQYDSISQINDKLRESYKKLPKSIQKSLSNLDNSTLDNINQIIDTEVQNIQNYQTPSEISEKRNKIEAIESEIAETQAITAPQTSTQS